MGKYLKMEELYMRKCSVNSSTRCVGVAGILERAGTTAGALLCLLTVALILTGCGGGGGGVSSQVVSGVASVGTPLAGQVTIRDAGTPAHEKTTVIGNDGSFALDVTDLKAPFVLKASGNVNGVNYTLYSFAGQPGTANINPLSNVAVADAAGADDPATVFDSSDPDTLNRVKSGLSRAVAELLTKLKPLLVKYSADSDDPITGHYKADHTHLDGMFDNLKFTIANGVLTITNAKTGAVIFTGKVTDIIGGQLTDNDSDMPNPGSVPTAPTGVTATGGSNQVSISWSAVGNATSYNLYWSTTSGVTTANGTKVAGVTSPYLQTGLSDGTAYYYIVTAVNNAGESVPSSESSATTNATPPPPPPPTVTAAPTGVMAAGGTQQVTISWSAVSGAVSYNLYWSTTPGVTVANGTKIAGAVSPAVQIGLSDSTTYYYIVTAMNNVGESAPSVQVAATTLTPAPAPTAPSAPTGVTAVGGSKQVSISWSAVSGATSYNLYRSTTSGVTPSNGTRISGVTSPYVNTGLSDGTAYYYVVTAVNSVGESAASSEASATTNPPPPTVTAAPTGVTATGGAQQVSVSWSSVTGALSYNLYWSTTSGVTVANGTEIAGASSPYVQTGLADSTTYYYIVTAVNIAGESPASAQASATTAAPAPTIPAAPAGVTATGGTKQVSISWNGVGNATSYNLYWSITSGVTPANGTKVTGASSPYVQTGLADGASYYYIVTALNSAGESAASAQATATTTTPTPAFDALAFYNTAGNCITCHGAPSGFTGGRTAADLQSAISSISAMRSRFSTLTSAQVAAIAAILGP